MPLPFKNAACPQRTDEEAWGTPTARSRLTTSNMDESKDFGSPKTIQLVMMPWKEDNAHIQEARKINYEQWIKMMSIKFPINVLNFTFSKWLVKPTQRGFNLVFLKYSSRQILCSLTANRLFMHSDLRPESTKPLSLSDMTNEPTATTPENQTRPHFWERATCPDETSTALFEAFCMTRRPDGNFSHQPLQHNSQ